MALALEATKSELRRANEAIISEFISKYGVTKIATGLTTPQEQIRSRESHGRRKARKKRNMVPTGSS